MKLQIFRNADLVVIFVLQKKPRLHETFKWCLGTESNRRHRDFQSLALPTELPRQPICLLIHEENLNVQHFFEKKYFFL